jgi:hypothetical protein
MNLNAIANVFTRAVTPNITVTLYQGGGYTVDDEGDQVPNPYVTTVYDDANSQSLETRDLESLGIAFNAPQYNYVYLNTLVKPLSRVLQTGEDYLEFVAHNETATSKWMVVRQMENYQGWTKVLVCRQQ